MRYLLSIDEGTTNAKAMLIDSNGKKISSSKFEIPQYYPKPGWVEHNPEEIWKTQMMAIKNALEKVKIERKNIEAIGIANQRETTIMWDRNGVPLYNAIVWQCRRTAEFMDQLKMEYGDLIKEKTGLVGDAYFSASKIKWLLENVPRARERGKKGEIMVGTVDSYLLYKLTGVHATDYSNASRTLLFNIKKGEWDDELLEIFHIPEDILPEVFDSGAVYGYTNKLGPSIPIASIMGDQQAALFGQACFDEGMLKVTYGTGNFLLVNTGRNLYSSKNLLTTIAWSLKNKITYALEGSIFITGAALKWLKDIEIITNYNETSPIAENVGNNEDLYFVPAFSGLGAPYWDPYARGLLIGITRGTKKEHIVRATLESIGYLTRDVVEEIKRHIYVKEIRVDGGGSNNNFLMQFQSDILGIPVVKPQNRETTLLGSAFVAGLTIGVWRSMKEIAEIWKVERRFNPQKDDIERERHYSKWKEAVSRALKWMDY